MKHRTMTFLAGLLCGVVLFGGTTAAAGIVAKPAWSPIYVDGQQVQMEAYNINGSNYVKLRDIGQSVGFNVYWADGVQVDSTSRYTGEAPARPAVKETISIASVKGNTLNVGDRSGLVIDPAGPEYTASSSNPEVIAVEQVLTFWVAVAKAEGTAEITVTNEAGTTSRLALTVGAPEAEPVPAPSRTAGGSVDLSANMEIRQEMVRLINQVRRENGVAELEVNESLMNAAQYCSGHQFRIHGRHEWQALKDYGWPHGGSFNLTYFMAAEKQDIAQTAINNWINSPGHYQTMLCSSAACVGTGVYQIGGMVYCHMVAGDPNSCSPL